MLMLFLMFFISFTQAQGSFSGQEHEVHLMTDGITQYTTAITIQRNTSLEPDETSRLIHNVGDIVPHTPNTSAINGIAIDPIQYQNTQHLTHQHITRLIAASRIPVEGRLIEEDLPQTQRKFCKYMAAIGCFGAAGWIIGFITQYIVHH